MTVANQTNRISADGSGSAGQEVPFNFPYSATSDLDVYKRVTDTGVETALAETTNYTVTVPSDTGGTLTTVTAIETTEEIHIIRNTPKTQSLDLEHGGSFSAEDVEDALDKNTKLIVENKDSLDRALRAPATDAVALDLVIPNSVDRASKNLGFDAAGNATVTDSDGTFATATAVWDDVIVKSPWMDVRAFGADATGVSDSTAAILAAEAAAGSTGTVFFPEGDFLLTDSLLCTAHRYIGSGNMATILIQSTADTPIFEKNASLGHKLFQGFGLKATANGVYGFSSNDTSVSWQYLTFRALDFYQSLERGISANLIFAHIEDCRSGFLGTIRNGIHTALYIRGEQPGTGSNINYVENTHFFGAGNTANSANGLVDLQDNLTDWQFKSCDFESTETRCVYASGCYGLTFDGCWFEPRVTQGGGVDHFVFIGSDGTRGTRPTIFRNCWIYLVTATDCDHIVSVSSASTVAFYDCMGNMGDGYFTKRGAAYDVQIVALINNAILNNGGNLNELAHFPTTNGFELGQDGLLVGKMTLWDGAGGNTPGYIKIHSPAGTAWYGFVDDNGHLKMNSAVPTQNSNGLVTVCNENQIVCNENQVVIN